MAVGVLSLPPEVIVEIFQPHRLASGRSHYSDKERQHDLTILARTCRAFAGPAQVLLYASPSCTNVGRASLLERVVAVRPDLAAMATRFAWVAKNGLVDRGIAYHLLSVMPNLQQIELGAQLLQSPSQVDRFGDILQPLPLRTLVIGSPWMSSIGTVLPLLPGLAHLRHLELFNLSETMFATSSQDLEDRWPAYALESLSLVSIEGVTVERIRWLLGCTTSLKRLRLCLSPFAVADALALQDLLSPHKATLRDVDLAIDVHQREPAPAVAAMTSKDRLSLADALLPSFPHLTRLALGGYDRHEVPFLAHFRHDALVTLQLHDGRLAPDVGTALLEDRLPRLERLGVVNLMRGDPKAADLAWVCAARDVQLTLERRFA